MLDQVEEAEQVEAAAKKKAKEKQMREAAAIGLQAEVGGVSAWYGRVCVPDVQGTSVRLSHSCSSPALWGRTSVKVCVASAVRARCVSDHLTLLFVWVALLAVLTG